MARSTQIKNPADFVNNFPTDRAGDGNFLSFARIADIVLRINMTKNKWYLVFGVTLLLAGIFLVVMAFMFLHKPDGTIPWVRLGPMGLMCFIGGVGFLFLPAKIKLK